MRRLFAFFIDRPLLVNLMAIFIILVGWVLSGRMKREGLPVVDMREVHITTVYPGASPEDVELNVTIPIEEEIKGVSGLKEFTSVSKENLSRIVVKLDPDATDLDKIKSDLRRAVDSVNDLPAEVKDRPEVWELKVQNIAVIEVALTGKSLSERQLVDAAMALKKLLQQLSLVSKVEERGIRDREIQIKVDLARLNRNYLSFTDIINTLKSQNINLAGGNLESYISEKGIITVSRFESIKDVENVILRSNFEGKKIRLKEVAQVVDDYERRTQLVHFNGKNGVSLQVVKKEKSDIIRTIDQVKACVRRFQGSGRAKGVNFSFINDMSEETANRLEIVGTNALIGLVLVLVVLFLFLNLRTAAWTAAGLPISIFFAIILMYASGISINSISLSGIIVVLGMLVDDAIIIAENTYRHHLSGLSRREAALTGVTEVASPVTATIATTILAFLPILFMEGMTGDFAWEIPLVIAFTLGASLFEALFILPQHLAHTFGKKDDIPATRDRTEDRAILRWLEQRYLPLLDYCLKRRYALVAVFVALLLLAGWHAGTNMNFEMFDDDQAYAFYVRGETRRGSSLEKTRDDLQKVEALFKDLPKNELRSYITQIAGNIYGGSEDANFFSIVVYLTPANVRSRSAEDIVEELRSKMAQMPFLKKYVFTIDAGGPPAGRPLEIEIVCNDDKERLAALQAVRQLLVIPKRISRSKMETNILPRVKEQKDKQFLRSVYTLDKQTRTYHLQPALAALKPIPAQKLLKHTAGNTNHINKKLVEGRDRLGRILDQAGFLINGVYDIDDNHEMGKDELRIRLNYDRIARYGLMAHQVAEAIRTAYNGVIVTHQQTQEERIGYRVLLADRYRRDRSTLNLLKIANLRGNLIDVQDLLFVRERKSIKRIHHYNGDRTVNLSGNLDIKKNDTVAVYSKLTEMTADLNRRFPNTYFKVRGEAQESKRTLDSLGTAFMLAMVGVFFLLVLLFKSFTQPALVIIAIPFGLIGVVAAFTIHGMTFSMMAMLGITGLTGVVVNDSLVMIDYINKQRIAMPDKPIPEVVREGARTRLRPIILTTVTTAAGLLPTAYGIGGYDYNIAPMVLAISWGLVFATLLTLLLIPSLYVIEGDARRLVRRVLGNED